MSFRMLESGPAIQYLTMHWWARWSRLEEKREARMTVAGKRESKLVERMKRMRMLFVGSR